MFAQVFCRGTSAERALLLGALEGRGAVALEVGSSRAAGGAVAFQVSRGRSWRGQGGCRYSCGVPCVPRGLRVRVHALQLVNQLTGACAVLSLRGEIELLDRGSGRRAVMWRVRVFCMNTM